MSDNRIEEFPIIHDVLVHGDNIITMIAGSNILAGQVVAMNINDKVTVALGATHAFGVALYDAKEGDIFCYSNCRMYSKCCKC